MTTPDPLVLPTPREMVEYLDRYVRGQTRAKQDVAVAIYNHYLSQAYWDREGSGLGNQHILMLGPTGCGKTHIVRTIAEFLKVPFSRNSATSLVESGYKGRDVEEIIEALLGKAQGNPKLAERGIIFLDEIDKIRRMETGGQRDISGEGVQNALLTLLDGRESERGKKVDTSRILFICTGAFVGLQQIVEKRLGVGEKHIGFITRPNENLETIPDKPIYQALCQTKTSDLVEFGMIPEFIGRFATITTLHELSKDDLLSILGETTKDNPLERQRQLARLHGIELEITPEVLHDIADDASALGTGARALYRLLGRAVDSVDHRWPELADEGVTRVVIDRECVEEGQPPKLIKGEREHERIDLELRRESFAIIPPSLAPIAPSTGGKLPDGITNTAGWSDERLWNAIESVKREKMDWDDTTGSARKWWDAFEKENKHRPALIFRLCEELRNRKATVTEFFLSYVYSNTDNIQANLHYLDYQRLKKAEQERKRSKKDKEDGEE